MKQKVANDPIGSETPERTGGTSVSANQSVAHQNIGEAWLAIMAEVGYVQKLGKNTAQNYKYAGEAQLIEALRPALLKHQVICIPSEAKSRTTRIVVGDKKTFRTVIDYIFVYTHVPSSTHIQVAVVGEGVDTGDKSAYKAATGALKYALRQPFLIETGDEPEAHDIPEQKQTKKSGVFPTKTARKEFEDRLVKQMESAPDLGELKAVWDEAMPLLAELKASDSEEDSYSYAHMLKMKDMVKAAIMATNFGSDNESVYL